MEPALALEIALAGPTFWQHLQDVIAPGEEQFARQLGQFLAAASLPESPETFRHGCLQEVQAARKSGLFRAAVDEGALYRDLGALARLTEPDRVQDAERLLVGELSRHLADYSHLAELLRLEAERGRCLLVLAARFFFWERWHEDWRRLFPPLFALKEALSGHCSAMVLALSEWRACLSRTPAAFPDLDGFARHLGQKLEEFNTLLLAFGFVPSLSALRQDREKEAPKVRNMLQAFSEEILEALAQTEPSYLLPYPKECKAPLLAAEIRRQAEFLTQMKNDLVVCARGEGHFCTIGEALRVCPTSGTIRVRPGVYPESLVLNKPVHIIGDGPRAEIVVQGVMGSCVRVVFKRASVRGLTLRCTAGQHGKEVFAVDVVAGQLDLEDCDITSDSLSCLGIHGLWSDATVCRCVIHDGKSAGVFIYDQGQATVRDCDIFGNVHAGVAIGENANPTITGCRIHHGHASGVLVYEGGRGTLYDCDITSNTLSGVAIREGGNPTIAHCRIHDSNSVGVLVSNQGRGTLRDCDVFANALTGVEIREGSNLIVLHCQIHHGRQGGLWVYDQGQATVCDCDIFANASSGVQITKGGNPTLQKCHIHHNAYQALWTDENALGTVEECDLTDNKAGAWHLTEGCQIQRRDNKE